MMRSQHVCDKQYAVHNYWPPCNITDSYVVSPVLHTFTHNLRCNFPVGFLGSERGSLGLDAVLGSILVMSRCQSVQAPNVPAVQNKIFY
jgi:hypothetical protein